MRRVEQAGDHFLYIVRLCGGPDGDVERVEAVSEKLASVGAFDEVEGPAAGGTIEKCPVEVNDDEDAVRRREGTRGDESLSKVLSGRIRDATGCCAWCCARTGVVTRWTVSVLVR